jgi:hypothetical protein
MGTKRCDGGSRTVPKGSVAMNAASKTDATIAARRPCVVVTGVVASIGA